MNPYPRELRDKEKDLLNYVVPADRPGYRRYRDRIASMVALAEGRRGAGNLILGLRGDAPDLVSPLPPVVAYGMIETTRDRYSITVREEAGDQIDVEIVSAHQEEIPDHFEERRRWTYSHWLPGRPSPDTGTAVREVSISPSLILAFASEERRLWVHDGGTGMNHLIPVTNYYNELMLHKRIRDPKIALDSALLFSRFADYTEEDLRAAFLAYNTLKRRVAIPPPEPRVPESILGGRLKRWRRP